MAQPRADSHPDADPPVSRPLARVPDPVDFAAPIGQRLVTTRDAATLTGMNEPEFLALMGREGIRSQYMVWRGSRRLAIRVPDLVRVAAARLVTLRPEAPAGGDHTALTDRDLLELDLLRSQNSVARARIAQLEKELRARAAENDGLLEDLDFRRAESEANAARRMELIEARTLLGASRARVSAVERMLHESRRELEVTREALARAEALTEVEQERRGADQLAFSHERSDLTRRLEKRQTEIESLQRLLLAGRANQVELAQRLSVYGRLESASARYCDRLEARLAELEGKGQRERRGRARE